MIIFLELLEFIFLFFARHAFPSAWKQTFRKQVAFTHILLSNEWILPCHNPFNTCCLNAISRNLFLSVRQASQAQQQPSESFEICFSHISHFHLMNFWIGSCWRVTKKLRNEWKLSAKLLLSGPFTVEHVCQTSWLENRFDKVTH